MVIAYLIVFVFPTNPAEQVRIEIKGKFPTEMCESIRYSYPDKPNQLVVCSALREI